MALPRTERPRGLAAAAASDPGRERGNNEDRVLAAPDLGIFAVIDGVGGESAGEVAADIALEVLQARLSRRTTDLGRLVREAIALANRQIYERAKNDPHLAGMACVLTVAVLDHQRDHQRDGQRDGQRATVGHVGDSRLYALKAGEIRKVTPDHSPVGLREDAGELSEEEAMRHPRRNEIFRDVGSAPHEPDEKDWIDVLEVPFPADSALLLCSDGLSDMISSREIRETIEETVTSPNAEDAADAADVADLAVHALIERANRAGGRDNVSAVLVLGDRFAETVRRLQDGGGKRARSGRAGRQAEATSAGPSADPSVRSAERTPGRAAGKRSKTPELSLDRTLDRPAFRGAARARPGVGERLREILTGTVAKVVLVLALLLGAAFFFREPLEDALGLGRGTGPEKARDVLVVGIGDGGLASIGEALAQARPGQRIEVAPGEYHERLTLKDGVAIVSRTPRGAVLLPPLAQSDLAAQATQAAQAPSTLPPPGETPALRAVPAVSAKGIHGARLSGFKVLGSAAAPWSVGVRLDGSEVDLDGIEVTGTTGEGIEIRGADRSTLRLSYVHGNGGPGILITGNAAPRLQGNLIAGNGIRPGALAPGVEVREKAVPLLTENRIEGNGGGGVTLPGPERGEEIFRWNNFGTVPREQAVRALDAPAGPAAGVAARQPAAKPAAPAPSKAAPRSRP